MAFAILEDCIPYTGGVHLSKLIPLATATDPNIEVRDAIITGDRMITVDRRLDTRLRVYDISDPAAPELRFNRLVEANADRLVMVGNRILLLGEQIQIWTEDPDNSFLFSQTGDPLDLTGSSEDAAIVDDVLWVVGSFGVRTYSMVESGLSFVSSSTGISDARSIAVEGAWAFIAHDYTIGSFPTGDPAVISEMGTVDVAGQWTSVAVEGSFAYAVKNSSAFQVFDISDPQGPISRGGFIGGLGINYTGYSPLVVQNGYALVGEGRFPGGSTPNGVHVVDVRNPDAPALGPLLALPAKPLAMSVEGTSIHAALGLQGQDGFVAQFDFSDPDFQLEQQTVSSGAARGMSLDGDLLDVARGTAGLEVIDVADGTSYGDAPTAHSAQCVISRGGVAYVAEHGNFINPTGALEVFRVAEQNIQLITSLPIPDADVNTHTRAMALGDTKLCVVNLSTIVYVVDVQGLSQGVPPAFRPKDVAGLGALRDVFMIGDDAYVLGTDGITVLNVSDFDDIQELGSKSRTELGDALPFLSLDVRDKTAFIGGGALISSPLHERYGQVISVDAQDAANMRIRDSVAFPWPIRRIRCDGNRAIALAEGYAHILKIYDPDSMESFGTLPLDSTPVDVAFSPHGLYISHGDADLSVTRFACLQSVPAISAAFELRYEAGIVHMEFSLSRDVRSSDVRLVALETGYERIIPIERLGNGSFRGVDTRRSTEETLYLLYYLGGQEPVVIHEERLSGAVPRRQTLDLSVVPNPFNPTTNVEFSLDLPSVVEVSLFDSRGRVVRHLVNRSLEAGTQTIPWDGHDDDGRPLASGVYYVRVRTRSQERSKPVALIK